MRIEDKFKELTGKQETALIVYYTFGFPSIEESIKNIKILAGNGADMIEIGVPFSDPLADGVIIQQACQQALANNVTLKMIIREVSKFDLKIPLIFMSSLNPVFSYGFNKIFKDSRDAGISGFIIPDLPIDESELYQKFAEEADIDTIFLVSPVSSEKRIKRCLDRSKGFIYCISLTGTTGVRNEVEDSTITFIKNIKEKSDIPAAVGFGVSTREHVKKLASYTDGIIVGSRIIQTVINNENLAAVVRDLKQGTYKQK